MNARTIIPINRGATSLVVGLLLLAAGKAKG